MEYFFYEIRFPLGDLDGTSEALQALVHEWLGSHANCAVLILDATELVFQGFTQAPTRDKAFNGALSLAAALYRDHLGQEQEWKVAMVRNVAEHLAFLNQGLRPEYQLPAIDLVHVLEFSAAAIMRAGNVTDAQMFVAQAPH